LNADIFISMFHHQWKQQSEIRDEANVYSAQSSITKNSYKKVQTMNERIVLK